MIDLHRLRVLRSVMATESVSAAAAMLGYSPSAISQHLTALQRETRLQLIERRGRGIELTAAGRALAREAEAVLESMNGIDALVEDLRAGRVGSLSIGYFMSAGAAWVPGVVTALAEEFPNLRLELPLNDVGSEDYTDADIEIFVGEPNPRIAAGYTVQPLLTDPYVAVLPETHEMAERDAIALGELAHSRWIDNDPHRGYCRQQVLDACAEAGFQPQFRIEAPDYATAISFAASGAGITVVPALGLAHLPPGVRAIAITGPTPARDISVAIRAAVQNHPAALRTLELLHEQVGRQTGTPVPT